MKFTFVMHDSLEDLASRYGMGGLEFAELAGVSRSMAYALMAGSRNTGKDTVGKLAKYTGVKPDQIASLEEIT